MFSLLKCIDEERIKIIGYVYNDMMYSRHWFQFADDSAISTSTEEDSQCLLNVFTKWSKWANFIINIDKCKSFGVKKCGTKSLQYKPYLKISGQMKPAVEIDDSFTYLGKMFSFEMKNDIIVTDLVKDFNSYITKLDQLPLHPRNKMKVITIFIYSKIRWRLSIYDLSITWVIQNLDSIIKT